MPFWRLARTCRRAGRVYRPLRLIDQGVKIRAPLYCPMQPSVWMRAWYGTKATYSSVNPIIPTCGRAMSLVVELSLVLEIRISMPLYSYFLLAVLLASTDHIFVTVLSTRWVIIVASVRKCRSCWLKVDSSHDTAPPQAVQSCGRCKPDHAFAVISFNRIPWPERNLLATIKGQDIPESRFSSLILHTRASTVGG